MVLTFQLASRIRYTRPQARSNMLSIFWASNSRNTLTTTTILCHSCFQFWYQAMHALGRLQYILIPVLFAVKLFSTKALWCEMCKSSDVVYLHKYPSKPGKGTSNNARRLPFKFHKSPAYPPARRRCSRPCSSFRCCRSLLLFYLRHNRKMARWPQGSLCKLVKH